MFRGRIRIVHVALGLQVGGLEKLLVEFARHADRKQFDLHFVSLTARGKLADDIEACDWPVTALEQPSGLRPKLILSLARLFRQWRADVIHTDNNPALLHRPPAARLAGGRSAIHTPH